MLRLEPKRTDLPLDLKVRTQKYTKTKMMLVQIIHSQNYTWQLKTLKSQARYIVNPSTNKTE